MAILIPTVILNLSIAQLCTLELASGINHPTPPRRTRGFLYYCVFPQFKLVYYDSQRVLNSQKFRDCYNLRDKIIYPRSYQEILLHHWGNIGQTIDTPRPLGKYRTGDSYSTSDQQSTSQHEIAIVISNYIIHAR